MGLLSFLLSNFEEIVVASLKFKVSTYSDRCNSFLEGEALRLLPRVPVYEEAVSLLRARLDGLLQQLQNNLVGDESAWKWEIF